VFEDAANHLKIELIKPLAAGDLNGDGIPDAVVTLAANSGGSGVFSYISAVINAEEGAQPADTVFQGDRVIVRSIAINRRGELTVRLLERRFDQPMSTRPTIPVTRIYKLENGKLVAKGGLTNAALSNAAYPLDGAKDGQVFLQNGRYTDEASGDTVTLAAKPRASGDLNGDGSPDAAVLLVSSSEGSGSFWWVSAVLNDNYTAKPVDAVLLGDRIRARSLAIRDGEITVSYYDRRSDQPMTARPTVLIHKTFKLEGDQMSEVSPAAEAAPAAAPAATATATVTDTAAVTETAAAPEAAAIPALPGQLTGTVTYLQRIALEPNAVIEVHLEDVSLADAPARLIATQVITSEGQQVPIAYELSYDPAQIDPRNRYAVRARITVDGALTWISTRMHPVLTQDNPVTGVEIVVEPVPSVAPVESTGSVVDALAADPRFSMLAALVQEAGLADTLKEIEAVTVFAPTDDAFAKLPETAMSELKGNARLLTSILLYHVVTPTLMAADVAKAAELATLAGFPLPVSVDGDAVMVKDAKVIEADIQAGNGVVHAIDAVVTPMEVFGMADETELLAHSGVLTGNVTYLARIALPPEAVIEVTLADVTQSGGKAKLVTTRAIQAEGRQVPIPFELVYDVAAIDPQKDYAVSARILVNGRARWVTQKPVAVLTKDNPITNVEIVVQPAR
jgi:uncharacterized lipoprotein YbaY